MSWWRDGFESHEGTVGVLLADGSEPGPVYFDLGSGGHVHETTDWDAYDGELRSPPRSACGAAARAAGAANGPSRSTGAGAGGAYDTTVPERDWESRLDQVAARTLPLPGELTALLRRL
ncbi:hypothetical protein ACPB9E_37360 [Streptomyces exfoliatus]|uniref:hypothetical protein n=1 Tax=Streptomyces exfoliatus TaxID=1905 RepID=UPI003C2C6FD9